MSENTVNPVEPEAVPGEDEISLLDLLQVVVENLRLLMLGPIVAGLLALGVAFVITPTFTASTKFMPPQQQASAAANLLQSLGALGGLAGAASGIKSPSEQYVSFLKSRSVQDALIDRFKLSERYEKEVRQDTRKVLEDKVRSSSGKDGLISIEVDDKDPEFAAKLANAHIEELSKLLNRLAVTEAQQRRMFFERQLTSAKDNLAKAEHALRGSGVSPRALKSSPQASLEGLAKLKASIAAQEVKLASMRGYLAESAPDFKQAQVELTAMREQMAKAGSEDSAPIKGDADYVSRYRDYKYFETLYELFAKQYEIARVDESREGAVIQVVDVATPPERKTGPKRGLIAVVAALATGLVLLLFVFVRNALLNGAQTPDSAEKLDRLRQAWRHALGRT